MMLVIHPFLPFSHDTLNSYHLLRLDEMVSGTKTQERFFCVVFKSVLNDF